MRSEPEVQTPRRPRARFHQTPENEPLLEKLVPEHRDVLAASGSYEDIAAQLSLPVGTVKSRLHRARKALEKMRAGGGESA